MKTTDFGYTSIAWDEKQKKVDAVFHSVAKNYDLMNDIMSLGMHRVWKKIAAEITHIRPGQKILDLAGGSGDLTRLLCRKTGECGQVILADINEAMINTGRDRLLNEGLHGPIHYVQANAESLPFEDNSFHCIIIGFGLRNVTDKEAAIRSMYRVLKPGGKLLILEFSKPQGFLLNTFYDWYSFTVMPVMGQFIAGDADSYRYLAESIRMHPDQKTLKGMVEKNGFEDCSYLNLSGGIVALHTAYKY